MDYLNSINQFIQKNADWFWNSGFSFTIENLDNPGWHLALSNDENLGRMMEMQKNWESEDSWLKITADKHKFDGICGCAALDELLKYSLIWLNISDLPRE